MEFCANCQTIINTLFERSRYQRLPPDNLVEHFLFRSKYYEIFSITAKCKLCAFVRLGLPKEDVVREGSASWPADSLSMWIQAKGGNAFRHASTNSGLRLWQVEVLMVFEAKTVAERFNVRFSVTAFKGTRSPCLASHESELALGSPAAKAGDVLGTNPLTNSPVSDALAVLSDWLEECVSCHENCAGIDTTKPELPTRVLDVCPVHATTDQIRLIEPHGLRADYAALSHCWGPPTKLPLRTTKTTLHPHLTGIQLSQLPKTFQDAVVIARSVNLKYLWIDSLCIIQDDFEDWKTQAPLMGQLYSRAQLVIAATGSRDSSEGCFLERSTAAPSIDIPYVREDGVSDGCIQLSMIRHSDSVSIELEPLGQRGWVLQEWALARRIVHFTTKGMLWSCPALKHTSMCEDGNVRGGTRAQDWNGIIDGSTWRKLTYLSDKLTAVEGIARIMQRGREDQYISGLWTGDMPQQLFWVARLATRPLELQCFPTWSWASTQGPCVTFGPERIQQERTTMCSRVEPKDPSTLVLTCQASKLLIKKISLNMREATQGLPLSGILVDNTIAKLQYFLLDGTAHHLLDPDTQRVVGLGVLDDNTELEEDYCVYTGLLVMKETCDDQELNEVQTFLALLVREADSPVKAYRRIGVAFIVDEQVFETNDKNHFTIV
jgi:hypothetical protein